MTVRFSLSSLSRPGLAVFRSDLEACGILERNSALIHAR
jgi:hypothetical protein